MRSPRSNLSRRELGLVAAALLVPLPLFALTGFSVPLPNAIERGLGGLITIDAQDELSGTNAPVDASENGRNTSRSANASPAVTRARSSSTPPRLRQASTMSSGSTRSTDNGGTGGDANTHHEDSPDENGGGTGSPDGSGEPGPSGDSTPASTPSNLPGPSAQIGVTGQGAGSLATIDGNGVHVGVSADGADSGTDDPGNADVVVTHPDGSSTGVGVGVPGAGAPIP